MFIVWWPAVCWVSAVRPLRRRGRFLGGAVPEAADHRGGFDAGGVQLEAAVDGVILLPGFQNFQSRVKVQPVENVISR